MSFEHKEGMGTLFNNGFKQNEKQPDLKGDIMINGQLMSIAGWKKAGMKGEFISIKVSEKLAVKKSDLPPPQEDDFFQNF